MFILLYIHKKNNLSLYIKPFRNIKLYYVKNINLYELYNLKEKNNKIFYNIMDHLYSVSYIQNNDESYQKKIDYGCEDI